MKKFLSFTLAMTFLLGCASEISRDIANEVDVPLTFEELMTFKSTTIVKEGADIPANFKLDQQYLTEFSKKTKLDKGSSYRLEFGMKDNKYLVTIHYSEAGKIDQGAIDELSYFFNTAQTKFESKYSLMELIHNAKHDHIPSLLVLARLRKDSLQTSMTNNMYYSQNANGAELEERFKYWEEKVKEFEKANKLHRQSLKSITEKRKTLMDKLDKVSEDKQLKTLIAKNDRKGVAKMIRSYLPWEMMPPFEREYWETQLAIMEDPLPIEKRIFIYRGISDDLINTAIVKGEELTKDQALREHKIFLMSTLLTKNQGSWNRRLRSLTAMYEKFIATNSNESTYTSSARISTMFANHAGDPRGSPFLSLTPAYSIAESFGYNRKTIYFLDPRSIDYNTSGLSHEYEFLRPMVTFPDELGAVYDSTIHADLDKNEETFKKMAIENLDREYGKGKGAALFKKIEANSKSYFSSVKGEGLLAGSPFFKTMLGKDTAVVAKKITPKTDMQCMDIVQLFWK